MKRGLLLSAVAVLTAFASSSPVSTAAAQAQGGDLAVTIGGPSRVKAGTELTYQATVRNNGPGVMSGAILHIDLRGSTVLKAAGCTRGRYMGDLYADCKLPALQPGQSQTVRWTSTMPKPSPTADFHVVQTFATVYPENYGSDSDPTNNYAFMWTESFRQKGDLRVGVQGPKTAAPKSTIKYRVKVWHSGRRVAEGTRLVVKASKNVTSLRASGCTWRAKKRQLVCSLGLISGQGLRKTITIRAVTKAKAGSKVTVAAKVTAVAPKDPTPANNKAKAVTSIVKR